MQSMSFRISRMTLAVIFAMWKPCRNEKNWEIRYRHTKVASSQRMVSQ